MLTAPPPLDVTGRLQAGRLVQVSIEALGPKWNQHSNPAVISSNGRGLMSPQARQNEQRRCFKKAGVEDLSVQILQDASRDALGGVP